MTDPAFRAVQDPHGYFLGPKELESPSKVFLDLGLVNPAFFTREGRERGLAVHAGLHFALKGTLDWATLHPALHGFVHSGIKLVERLKPKILRFETPLYHPVHLFAGTYDIEWELGGWPYIVDWKSGKAAKVTRYQTAAYAMMAAKLSAPRPHKRAAVELQEDGSMANWITYDDHTDGMGWLNLLGAYRIRQALRQPPIGYVPHPFDAQPIIKETMPS